MSRSSKILEKYTWVRDNYMGIEYFLEVKLTFYALIINV